MRRAALALGLAVVAALAVHLSGQHLVPTSDQSDLPQFWTAPRELLAGRDPYARPPWGSPYPLWTMILLTPLALLPYEAMAAVWPVLQVATLTVALSALVRALGAGRREMVLLFGLAAASQPLWLLVAGGNITGFLAALLAGALAAHASGRPLLAGLLTAGLLIKPHPLLIAGPLLAFGGRPRPGVAIAALMGAGTLLAASLVARPTWIGEWIGSATALQTSVGSNATLWTLDRVGGGHPAVAIALGASVAAFLGWWRAVRPPFVTLVAGAVPVSLAVAPHGWSYDHLLLLVTAATILVTLAGLPARARIAGTVALFAIGGALPWCLYWVAFARGGEELSVAVPLLHFALLVLGDRAARRARLRAPSRRTAAGPFGTAPTTDR